MSGTRLLSTGGQVPGDCQADGLLIEAICRTFVLWIRLLVHGPVAVSWLSLMLEGSLARSPERMTGRAPVLAQ